MDRRWDSAPVPDVSYFFNDRVGVGGTVSFGSGTVDTDEEPLSEDAAGPKVGQIVQLRTKIGAFGDTIVNGNRVTRVT